jgi:hypothetical protein
MSDLMLDVGQANELKLAFRKAGYEASDVKKLCEGHLLAQVLQVLLGNASIVSTGMPMLDTITVLPSLTMLERIALGDYHWKDPGITNELFPHDTMTVGEWEYDLYSISKRTSSENVVRGAEVDNWTLAKGEHLFALGQVLPNKQRTKGPIIAAGFIFKVSRYPCVLELWRSNSLPVVNLCCWGGDWNSDYRFLRVRKVQ